MIQWLSTSQKCLCSLIHNRQNIMGHDPSKETAIGDTVNVESLLRRKH
jgi:hypothetical protein